MELDHPHFNPAVSTNHQRTQRELGSVGRAQVSYKFPVDSHRVKGMIQLDAGSNPEVVSSSLTVPITFDVAVLCEEQFLVCCLFFFNISVMPSMFCVA
jgi:hypothetical protein